MIQHVDMRETVHWKPHSEVGFSFFTWALSTFQKQIRISLPTLFFLSLSPNWYCSKGESSEEKCFVLKSDQSRFCFFRSSAAFARLGPDPCIAVDEWGRGTLDAVQNPSEPTKQPQPLKPNNERWERRRLCSDAEGVMQRCTGLWSSLWEST